MSIYEFCSLTSSTSFNSNFSKTVYLIGADVKIKFSLPFSLRLVNLILISINLKHS